MTSASNDLKHPHGDAQILRVHLLYFGAAREEAGRDEEQFEVRAPATAASVLAEVLSAHPALRRFGRSLLVAVNEEYAGARRLCATAMRSPSSRPSAAARARRRKMTNPARKIFLN
jgi:molybdopterin converting factor small subunit